MMQVRYVKTIVGWWNLYLVSHNPQAPVTVPPARMTELFAEISPKAKFGCGEISAAQAKELFGENLKEVRIA
ncbi:hypothetical protein COJ96_06790 [Bacillus sp. AFS073361]|uniref:hypothetical protein n=1 Tax=Bacillus sp. AFS073361 TaxID=2033511 RepID=UPI000BF38085|nr:hypothetical protein [Bacillus sp. AFS073361]PFP30120.1 hypothetical protein COJ96_06790 [Bacillus sp. AFS073361]